MSGELPGLTLPDEIADGSYETVALDALPSDEELQGEDPDAQFVASIRRIVIHPIALIRDGQGGFHVCAGRRRIKAARKAGRTFLPAMVFPVGTAEGHVQHMIALIENEQRRKNAASDVMAILNLLTAGAPESEILRATGMAPQVYRARLRLIQGLKTEFLAAYLNGYVAMSVAEALARLDPETQERLYQRFQDQTGLTLKQVREASRVESAQIGLDLPDELTHTPGIEEAFANLGEPEIAGQETTGPEAALRYVNAAIKALDYAEGDPHADPYLEISHELHGIRGMLRGALGD